MTTPPAARWLAEVPLAHRGLWGADAPENSLAAFAAARRAGVGIELDVRLSGDGQAVVFHDRDLARLTARPGRVDDHTAAQLAEFHLGDGDDRIPTLAAALDVAGDQPVMVEVKSVGLRVGPLESAVARVLVDHPGPTCVAGFNPAVLRWFRRNHPAVPRVLTVASRNLHGSQRAGMHRGTVRVVEPVAISVELAGLDLPVVARHRARGMPVVAWTVRTAADLASARAGADGVIFEALPPAVVLAPDRP